MAKNSTNPTPAAGDAADAARNLERVYALDRRLLTTADKALARVPEREDHRRRAGRARF